MKITDKILSIPPYISTSWKNIVSLQVEARTFGHVLVIELVTGSKVEVPNLDRQVIEKVFSYHANVVEQEGLEKNTAVMTAAIPFPFPFPNFENLGSMIQHNEEQKDSPPLPADMLEKIAAMTKDLVPEDSAVMQQPVEGCNCPHCQIVRAVTHKPQETPAIEEVVSDEDLKFRTWDIHQEGEKLYTVKNPLDPQEQYRVFLGDPLGCSCGSKNCEHLQAVLKS